MMWNRTVNVTGGAGKNGLDMGTQEKMSSLSISQKKQPDLEHRDMV